MEEEKQETCPNCKREIPTVNFQIHVVHCERNIRMCPVCKEPILQTDLEKHHEKLHKPQPCKQCGESVCGTDLEDHIRDSCANTVKSCRYCELDLPRREIPAHEGYCGVRTEQCPDCQEWVMIKYKQLHLDSNHGFIRLDDDPAPPANFQPKVIPIVPINRNGITTAAARPPLRTANWTNNTNTPGPSKPRTRTKKPVQMIQDHAVSSASLPQDASGTSRMGRINPAGVVASTSGFITGNISRQTPVDNTGAIKKRQAPQPPLRVPPRDPRRDLAFYSALQRQQYEDRQRAELNANNLARGLPPVLNPAQKVEKLRKMDALLNPERQVAQNSVFTTPNTNKPGDEYLNHLRRYGNFTPMTQEEFRNRFEDLQLRAQDVDQRTRDGIGWSEPRAGASYRRNTDDRFNEIKSSLRELRRGLNEVTAPYNANSNVAPVTNRKNGATRAPSEPASPEATDASDFDMDANPIPRERPTRSIIPINAPARASSRPTNVRLRTHPLGSLERAHIAELSDMLQTDAPNQANSDVDMDVQLPCEFCNQLLPAAYLVQHQAGCRPDLAQLRPRALSPPAPLRRPYNPDDDTPLIPCEFCTKSFPVYVIDDHQQNCPRREEID